MAKTKDRIIVDTNLWISFLLTRNFSSLDMLFATQSVTLLFSQELLNEFIEVARRPKFKKHFSSADLKQLLQALRLHSEIVVVSSTETICRDPKDNFLLSLAADGKATHLLTGDKDLLELKTYKETKILTLAAYRSDK